MKSRVLSLLHCECARMSGPNGEKGRADVACMELYLLTLQLFSIIPGARRLVA